MTMLWIAVYLVVLFALVVGFALCKIAARADRDAEKIERGFRNESYK
jgi:hypothetical protein